MTKIRLGGNSGIDVPTMGIGTWAWGDRCFWAYGKDYQEVDLRRAFDASVEQGLGFFDTAEIYGLGESERLIGRFLKGSKSGSEVKIASKYMPVPWRTNRQSIKQAISQSLERLQLSAIDLYQVHQPFSFLMSQEDLLATLAEEFKLGRIKAIGVSNYSARQMRQAYEILAKRGVRLATNQVQYSLLSRQVEENGVLDTAAELGIAILAYSPLAQGLLTGKYKSQRPPKGLRQFDPRFGERGLFTIEPVIKLLRKIGEQYNRSPAQVALNWLIEQGNVIPIPGAKNADQAKHNAGALGWQMQPEDLEGLERVTRPWLKS
ncbi:MAG: aldo/keto reductase [Pseudanabaenaceae cyanobacterium bins.68]|nr:aldo/keto reductase [Pseudanabaenaceae cyanobacterium bins.68]